MTPEQANRELESAVDELNELAEYLALDGFDIALTVSYLLIPATECRPPHIKAKIKPLPYRSSR